MATIWRPLVQSAFGKKMALRFPFYLLPNIFSHNYSKSQWNLSNYGRFSIYFELSCNLVQPRPCSSSRLEMATIRRPFVQSGFGKKMALGILPSIAWSYKYNKSSKYWWNIKKYMSFRIYFSRSSIWVQPHCSNSNSLEAVIKWSQDVLFENVCGTEKIGNKFGPKITTISFTNWCPEG